MGGSRFTVEGKERTAAVAGIADYDYESPTLAFRPGGAEGGREARRPLPHLTLGHRHRPRLDLHGGRMRRVRGCVTPSLFFHQSGFGPPSLDRSNGCRPSFRPLDRPTAAAVCSFVPFFLPLARPTSALPSVRQRRREAVFYGRRPSL